MVIWGFPIAKKSEYCHCLYIAPCLLVSFGLGKTVLLDSVSFHLFSKFLIQDERAAQIADLR
jgi:hypothetical protein